MPYKVIMSHDGTEKNIEKEKKRESKKKLRRRYNKMVVIDLKKRAHLRNLVKQNTLCEHKQIYTQANAICRRISSSYEEGKISSEDGMNMMLDAHHKMSHLGLSKEAVKDEMNNELDRLEGLHMKDEKNPVVKGNRINRLSNSGAKSNEDKYSESYWQEII